MPPLITPFILLKTSVYDCEVINRYLSTLDIPFLIPIDQLLLHQRQSMDPNWDWKFMDTGCINPKHETAGEPCPQGGGDTLYCLRYARHS